MLSLKPGRSTGETRSRRRTCQGLQGLNCHSLSAMRGEYESKYALFGRRGACQMQRTGAFPGRGRMLREGPSAWRSPKRSAAEQRWETQRAGSTMQFGTAFHVLPTDRLNSRATWLCGILASSQLLSAALSRHEWVSVKVGSLWEIIRGAFD